MKKTIGFGLPGGFPLVQDTLDFMQKNNETLNDVGESLVLIHGSRYIIVRGCTPDEEDPEVLLSGVVVFDGEYLPFIGGRIREKVKVTEQKQSVVFMNEEEREVYISRYVEFTDDIEAIQWSVFKAIKEKADIEGNYPNLKSGDSDRLGGIEAEDYMLKEDWDPDPWFVGEHRLIRNEVQFNDPRYLPMNGSRVLVSDHPDIPFLFPDSLFAEVIELKTLDGINYLQLLDISLWNGVYVGVDGNGYVVRSTDLRNWEIEQPLPVQMRGAAIGNGVLLAGGNDGVYRSVDSVEWQKVSNLKFEVIRFGGGAFCGIANNTIYTSYDGITFEQRGVPQIPFYDIAYHNGLWVACAGYGVIISTDLITWTKKGPTSGSTSFSVQYCHDKWIVGTVTGKILISDDAMTWTTKTVDSKVTSFIYRAAYYDGKYIVIYGQDMYMTTDFTTWTTKTMPEGSPEWKVLYTDDGEMLIYRRSIFIWNKWYELPDYSNSDYTCYLKAYKE